METRADAEIVRQAEHFSGQSAGSVAFGTEAPYFAALGLQTVILGAGDIACAHQPDEYVTLEQTPCMVRVLQGLIHHFCLRV